MRYDSIKASSNPGRSQGGARRGAVTVEAAVIYPLLFLLLFGLIVGGITVFRYQQMVLLSREAARYTSVRGSDWTRETNLASPTAAEIVRDVVLPLATGMEPELLTVKVEWVSPATSQVVDWDLSRKSPTSLNAQGEPVANRVRVTVVYQWNAGVLFSGALTLTSVCEMPMTY